MESTRALSTTDKVSYGNTELSYTKIRDTVWLGAATPAKILGYRTSQELCRVVSPIDSILVTVRDGSSGSPKRRLITLRGLRQACEKRAPGRAEVKNFKYWLDKTFAPMVKDDVPLAEPETEDSSVRTWLFEGHTIRVVLRDNAPWLVLADLCGALGITNVGNVADRVREVARDGVRQTDSISDKLGRKPLTTIVNEAAFYRVILESRSPNAERLKLLVTEEILPAVRVLGADNVLSGISAMLNDLEQAPETPALPPAPATDPRDALLEVYESYRQDMRRALTIIETRDEQIGKLVVQLTERQETPAPTAAPERVLVDPAQFPKGLQALHEYLVAKGVRTPWGNKYAIHNAFRNPDHGAPWLLVDGSPAPDLVVRGWLAQRKGAGFVQTVITANGAQKVMDYLTGYNGSTKETTT